MTKPAGTFASMPPRLFLLVALLAGCRDYTICDPPDAVRLESAPPRLSETGLFSDMATERLGPNVRAYTPAFELWSDGATKRRWILLPEGAPIDASDPDDWSFPVGTRLFKEFTRDGVRVETRMLERVGPGEADWLALSYVWDGDDAYPAPEGRMNALGTEHDVPAADRCMGCHGGRGSRVLGFSAIQLSTEGDGWTLEALNDAGVLVPAVVAPVIFGDATERAALGFLHANCAHCHNQARPSDMASRCFDPENGLDFWLRVADDDVWATATYRTAVGSVIAPRNPGGSALYGLATQRGAGRQMPPLATDALDPIVEPLLRAWIEAM